MIFIPLFYLIMLNTTFLGRPLEDEVFGLPGGNYPKEAGRSRNLFHYGSGMHKKRFSSLDKETARDAQQQLSNTSDTVRASPTSKKPRKYSLERDVYYFENDRREEVVNYEAGGPTGSKSNLGIYYISILLYDYTLYFVIMTNIFVVSLSNLKFLKNIYR